MQYQRLKSFLTKLATLECQEKEISPHNDARASGAVKNIALE